jgi:transposase
MKEEVEDNSIVSSIDEKKVQRKGKWSEDEHETIVDTLRKYSILSLKSIRAHLSSKHSIEISEGVLGKIRKEL